VSSRAAELGERKDTLEPRGQVEVLRVNGREYMDECGCFTGGVQGFDSLLTKAQS